MRSCSRRAPTGIRNRAIIVTMYRGGLRCLETLNLKLRDIDRDGGTIRIRRGKGGRARTIAIDPSAMSVVEQWIDTRSKLGLNGGPIFSTLAGGELATSYVRTLLTRLGRKAKIEKRVHPHGLRHSFTVEMAKEGIPVPVIQLALGHASLATTTTYLKGLGSQDVIDAMRGRAWTA